MSHSLLSRTKEEIRMALIGLPRGGKSKVGTALLFPSDGFDSSISTTASAIKLTQQLNKTLALVDTPGIDNLPRRKLAKELKKVLDVYCFPGPHLFLFCVSMGRITEDIEKIKSIYVNAFGRNITKYILFVFTNYDQWLEDMKEKDVPNPSFEQYILDLPFEMLEFMKSCGNAYTIFDISQKNKTKLAESILKPAMKVIENNGFAYLRKTRLERATDMCCRLLGGFCCLCRYVWNFIASRIRRVRYNVI